MKDQQSFYDDLVLQTLGNKESIVYSNLEANLKSKFMLLFDVYNRNFVCQMMMSKSKAYLIGTIEVPDSSFPNKVLILPKVGKKGLIEKFHSLKWEDASAASRKKFDLSLEEINFESNKLIKANCSSGTLFEFKPKDFNPKQSLVVSELNLITGNDYLNKAISNESILYKGEDNEGTYKLFINCECLVFAYEMLYYSNSLISLLVGLAEPIGNGEFEMSPLYGSRNEQVMQENSTTRIWEQVVQSDSSKYKINVESSQILFEGTTMLKQE